MNQPKLLRNFTHITIPAEIWLRKGLSIQAKALWAEMRSLHCKEKGGCYASDEYLMEFMDLKRSRLHEIYKELKEAGLMEIVSNDGRGTVKRAIVPQTVYVETGQQISGKPDTTVPENRIDTYSNSKVEILLLPPTSRESKMDTPLYTEEEEELLDKKFKERGSKAPKINGKKRVDAWKRAVIEDVREEIKAKNEIEDECGQRKLDHSHNCLRAIEVYKEYKEGGWKGKMDVRDDFSLKYKYKEIDDILSPLESKEDWSERIKMWRRKQ